MDREKMYAEEDLFPREITSWEERDYGILFYNVENKDSFDSNHAVLFQERVHDAESVLKDIVAFYRAKGIRPTIYQSIREEGYFEEIGRELTACGFEYWTEPQRYMVLSGSSMVVPAPGIAVEKISEWKDEFRTGIFERAGEPWETDVAKRALMNSNTLFFVACVQGQPVGMTHCHVTDGICRVDYLLVSKMHRNMGVGRALISSFVEYCRRNHIENCYLWPDGETAEKIYSEAGFRYVETKYAGRATYQEG